MLCYHVKICKMHLLFYKFYRLYKLTNCSEVSIPSIIISDKSEYLASISCTTINTKYLLSAQIMNRSIRRNGKNFIKKLVIKLAQTLIQIKNLFSPNPIKRVLLDSMKTHIRDIIKMKRLLFDSIRTREES